MPISMPVRTEGEAERAIESFARSPNGALFALPESSTVFHRTTIIETTNRLRLPALFPFRFCAIGGGLASYGLDIVAQCKGAASYADKILRGTNPGDLPVQAPTKMELVINQKTAKALGLTVPETLLARADEVIE
jgi:putative ABC transport system substrate-binding protein